MVCRCGLIKLRFNQSDLNLIKLTEEWSVRSDGLHAAINKNDTGSRPELEVLVREEIG